MHEVVTIGESLVALIPDSHTKLRYVNTFSKVVAGAESNVAVGLAKLGHKASWLSKVGADELGHYVIRELRAEGVDTSAVIMDSDHPTGLMIKEFTPSLQSSVYYYRKGSAASTLSVDEIDWDFLRKAKIIHISGITPALSPSCKEVVEVVARFAKKEGIPFSFDPNIRKKLWSMEEAIETLTPLFSLADLVLLGDEEAQILLGTDTPEEVVSILHQKGVSTVALKLGEKGAYVSDGKSAHYIAAHQVTVVDTIGAGDAFNAGFLAGILEGKPIEVCGRMGAIMGALAVGSYGDTEGLPDRSAFDAVMHNTQEVQR
ncbi:MAG: sugar kinase [Spirochaetales bacterium]|nr:sugar kinase [Spirochaetales bacterium]